MVHLNYARYVLSHKCYVFQECAKRGLYWRGIKHDLSKFRPSEWMPYAHFFNGERTDDRKDAFHVAFNHHIKRNDHHWQYWVVQFEGTDKGTPRFKALPMPDVCVKEMVSDWIGAGKAQGGGGVNEWYSLHRDKIMLHPLTRMKVENMIRNEPALTKKSLSYVRPYNGDGK